MELLQSILTIENLLMMNLGLFAGVVMGALPGLSVIFAIAVLLPLTFDMDTLAGMYLLLGAYCGATYGGSISAVLLNTPGTPAATATVFDGYPLSQKGRAGDALKASLFASTVGGIISCLALIFFAPTLAKIALKINSPEYFALCVFGLTATVGVSSGNVIKGLVMTIIGLLLSTVGIDTTEGVQRLVFGQTGLLAGFKPVTVMLGMFALSEVLMKSRQLRCGEVQDSTSAAYSKATVKVRDMLKYWKTILKSSLFGVGIGALPGTGGAIAAMYSYNEAKRASKRPEKFGTGSIEGVLAPEAANNACTGATMIPLLALGIPGDASVAVLLGALTMQGITPGSALFESNSIWVYAIMGGLLLINIFMLLQGSVFIRVFANITRVPPVLLLPCIMILCAIGAFAIANSAFDMFVMVAFGLFGYVMRFLGFPVAPLAIGLVLGNLTETNLRRSLMLSYGDPLIFFKRPISLCILLVAALTLFYPGIKKGLEQLRDRRNNPARTGE